MTPNVGTGGTKVVLKSLHPFRRSLLGLGGRLSPIAVKFGALPAAYASINPDGTITAATPYGGQPGKEVKVTAVVNGTTFTSIGPFTYPIAHMSMTGPMAWDAASSGDTRWYNGGNHAMGGDAPAVLNYSEPPVFHVAAEFNDDSVEVPARYSTPFAVGNYGVFMATLQDCDVSHAAAPGPSQCKNWDGNTGTWVNAEPAVKLRLDRGAADISVPGDLVLKTTGLFDQVNLVRTLRIFLHIEENDTNQNIGSDRMDGTYTSAFTAVVAPSAFIQVKVVPFTIVYQPPGNASTAVYQTSNTFSTSFKLGTSTEKNNSSSTQQTDSTKSSIKLTLPLAFTIDPATGNPKADNTNSGAFGVDMGESWDTTTKEGFGTAEGSTNTSSNTVAFQTQWTIPANPDLIPGNGSTCISATDCSLLAPAANPRAIEPFWGDTFVFQVHPQFAMWVTDTGQTRYVQIAAVPVVATATVAQLAACWQGSNWLGSPACDLQYSHAILQSENGAPVSYAGSQNHVTLTTEEAHRFLLLDPFFQNGQNANVPADRAINLLDTQYGAMIGQRPRPVSQTLTRTQAQTIETTGSTSTTLSVTSVRGSDSTYNVSETLLTALNLGTTVASGTKLTTAADMKTTFNNSTAVSTTNATQVQMTLNDQDTTSGCTLPHCHLPLPNRPAANVFLDKQFGGFMFQDPGAPAGSGLVALSAAGLKSRVDAVSAAVGAGMLKSAKPTLRVLDVRRPHDANQYNPEQGPRQLH